MRWFQVRRQHQLQQLQQLVADSQAAEADVEAAQKAIEAARGGTSQCEAISLCISSYGLTTVTICPGVFACLGPGEAMRAAHAALKAAQKEARTVQQERRRLETHLWRTDPERERRARHLDGAPMQLLEHESA